MYRKLIEFMNSSDSFIFSVDIPSGVNGDTGQYHNVCVMADATGTMCYPKRGNYLYPGRAAGGDLYVVDIGIPYHLIDDGYPQILEYDNMFELMPVRAPDGHKGTFGTVLVVAGARGFSGAAAMASLAALRAGAGLVRLAAPRGIMDALESKLLEVVKIPLSQTADETIGPDAAHELIAALKDTDAIIIGPGITTHPGTSAFLLELLPRIRVPVVIDADALNILAQNPAVFKKIKAPHILTPHPGELGRITDTSPQDINQDRIDISRQVSKDLNAILVLKGAPTVIAMPGGECYVNPTGNSGLASAGSGDVLAGLMAGFLAQRSSPSQASRLGVFLHGLCADLCLDEKNEYSLIAGDLIDRIPDAINYILDRTYREDQHDE
jgi:NAD(P)H-hydrate epimerase